MVSLIFNFLGKNQCRQRQGQEESRYQKETSHERYSS